jgi:triacylglycerol lipase
MDPLPPFTPDGGRFNLVNAFWLSEISRLIYRRNIDEAGLNACGPSRNTILAAVGLRETFFLSRQETQCALLRTMPPCPDPFAVLVFRGTTGLRNWFLDIDVRPERIAPRTVAHRGFMEALGQVWQFLEPHLEQLAEPLFITGHSMGGALAQLAAWHHLPRAVYSFGAPRVGDAGFARHMTPIPIYRLVNGRDVVPDLPPSTRLLSFSAAGRMVHIDRKGRICEMEPTGEPANCFESGRLSMSAPGEHWSNPSGFLVDHAPINYSAKIQKSLQAGRRPATLTSDRTTTDGVKSNQVMSTVLPIR